MTGPLNVQGVTAPPGKFVAVYITAKLIHAHHLVDIRKSWPRLYFTARWPLTAALPSEGAKPASLWVRDNETDILAADVVIGYSHEDETTPLSDPLWELGLAHAHRKPIYLAGGIDRFGKYALCSSVAGRYLHLENALETVSQRINYDSHADRIGAQLETILEEVRGQNVGRPIL